MLPTTQVRILRRPGNALQSQQKQQYQQPEQPLPQPRQQQPQQQSQQQQFLHINKNPSQDSNYQNCHQNKLNSTPIWNINNHEAASNNKKLLKTYQERADEYAKARLRILGSAFPESDESKLTTNTTVVYDGSDMMVVDRTMNLDVQKSAPSPSFPYTSSYASTTDFPPLSLPSSSYSNRTSLDKQTQRLGTKINYCSTTDNSLTADGQTSAFTEYDNNGDNRKFRNINNSLAPSTGCNSNHRGPKAK